MKKIISIILSVVITAIFALPVSYASGLPSEWAQEEINLAIGEGIVPESVMEDYGRDITREQFCEMIVLVQEKISGKKMKKGSEHFSDTQNPQVSKAATLGIVKGFEDGTFRPDELVKREEMATMIVRMISGCVYFVDTNLWGTQVFFDSDDISEWAFKPMMFVYENGIMQGTGNGFISPKTNTTCEQAIVLLYRVFKKYNSSFLIETFFEKVGKEYYFYLQNDYDGDGKEEAFVITSSGDDSGIYNNICIWMVSSDGECSLVKSDLYGYYGSIIATEKEKFFVWEKNAGGSGSVAYIFGYKNGEAYEPEISEQYDSFVKRGDKYIAYANDFSKGYHDWIGYEYIFNSQTKEFETAPAEIEKTPFVDKYTTEDLCQREVSYDLNKDGNAETLKMNIYSTYSESMMTNCGRFEFVINGGVYHIEDVRHGYNSLVYITDIDMNDSYLDIVLIGTYKGAYAKIYRFDGQKIFRLSYEEYGYGEYEIFNISDKRDADPNVEDLNLEIKYATTDTPTFTFIYGDEINSYVKVSDLVYTSAY